MQGFKRKIIHAGLFELIAVVIVTLGMRELSGSSTAQAGGLAVSTSIVALIWNMAFNTLFEAWERRQINRERTVLRRMGHAICFEGGLVLMTVPMIAWWLNLDWWQALLTDLGLIAFFLFYAFGFNWLFDHLVGPPESAKQTQP
jgi:uncharacterized membrane protein